MAKADGAAPRTPLRELLADVLIVLGAGSVSVGVGLIHVPSGLVAAGACMVVIAVFGLSGSSR